MPGGGAGGGRRRGVTTNNGGGALTEGRGEVRRVRRRVRVEISMPSGSVSGAASHATAAKREPSVVHPSWTTSLAAAARTSYERRPATRRTSANRREPPSNCGRRGCGREERGGFLYKKYCSPDRNCLR